MRGPAADQLGGLSLDEALAILLFEHQTVTALGRMADDPAAVADYRDEAQCLADAEVRE